MKKVKSQKGFLESFQRITSSSKFIPEIDGLRFIAIVPVVFAHMNTNYMQMFQEYIPIGWTDLWIEKILESGGFGVKVFFAISGFILALPFAKEYGYGGKKVVIKKYFIRRLTRLEPPFIIAISTIFIGGIFIGKYDLSSSLPHLLATFTYSHVFVYGVWSSINPVSWSLETEVQFYILAPLLSMMFKIKRKYLFYIFLFLCFALLYFFMPNYTILHNLHLNKSLLPYLNYFLIGFLLAKLYLDNKTWMTDKNILGDLLFILGLSGILYFAVNYHSIFFSISVLSCFIGSFKGLFFNKLITKKIITVIGGMCYSTYLLHYPLIYVTMSIFKPIDILSNSMNMLYIFSVSSIVVLIVSFVFFKYFEQPFMDKNWPEKFSGNIKRNWK